MTRKRLLVGGTVAAFVVAVVFFGGALTHGPSAGFADERSALSVTSRLAAAPAPADTAAYIARLERRVATRANDAEGFALLGLAYQQRARETADPTFYPRSDEALRRALRLERDNFLAITGLASLAAARHRFAESLEVAKHARRLAPRSATVYGLLGDAYLELGRYEKAFTAFDRMAALRPSTLAYARVSYARELLGETEGAVEAMKMAVAAAGRGEPVAWALVHLGNLYRATGDLAPAARAYREALAHVDGYAPALGGLARVSWWRGDLEKAARLFERALATTPVPEYAVGLGDVSAVLGRDNEAERAYARAEGLERAFAASGELNQLDTALFDLDHDREVVDALRRARIGYRFRPSIEGEHVLAWALYKNGRCDEARKHSIRALRLGTKDTGALLHRSFIEECLGNHTAARSFRSKALAVNPYALLTVGSPKMHGAEKRRL
jgi:tetratricopeptide (TPR) repeat protein